jgi:hypothetical protein
MERDSRVVMLGEEVAQYQGAYKARLSFFLFISFLPRFLESLLMGQANQLFQPLTWI